MKKLIFIIFALILGVALCNAQALFSPNGKIEVAVKTINGKPSLLINYEKRADIPVSIGLNTSQRNFEEVQRVEIGEITKVVDDYHMITGKKSHCHNEANETKLTLYNYKDSPLVIVIRAYNDGVAFKYKLPDVCDDVEKLLAENTSFSIQNGLKRWMLRYTPEYENFYPMNTNGINPDKESVTEWGFPALVEIGSESFCLLTEANIRRGHCGAHLANSIEDRSEYKIKYVSKKIALPREPDGSWESPWRVMIIGSLADVVESTLVTDVSAPCAIGDTSWIKPGVSSWIYWAYNNGSKDKKLLCDYVDLAAEMKWPLTLVDAEWDDIKDGSVEDVIEYSKSRGVKPMLWYNSSTAEWIQEAPGPKFRLNASYNRQYEFERVAKMGVVGLKIDFFRSEEVSDMDYYIDLLEDAADAHLLINFHGATIPRGWQRTYPNLMSHEAVYGAEWYNNKPTMTKRAASHNATLPFTRNVIGSMDYTPCAFTDSQHEHITSNGHELALTVLFESGIQHMADRPSSFLSQNDDVKAFLSVVPTAWDETKLISGYPGNHVVMARRSGNKWFVAGINGTDDPMQMEFDLTKLNVKGKTIKLIKDGLSQKEFAKAQKSVIKNAAIKVPCLPRGGFVAIIE